MKTNKTTPKNIDEYIAGFPTDVQDILKKVRSTIKTRTKTQTKAKAKGKARKR